MAGPVTLWLVKRRPKSSQAFSCSSDVMKTFLWLRPAACRASPPELSLRLEGQTFSLHGVSGLCFLWAEEIPASDAAMDH